MGFSAAEIKGRRISRQPNTSNETGGCSKVCFKKAEGHRNEARAMLAEISGRFTKGFDTADLKEANSPSMKRTAAIFCIERSSGNRRDPKQRRIQREQVLSSTDDFLRAE